MGASRDPQIKIKKTFRNGKDDQAWPAAQA